MWLASAAAHCPFQQHWDVLLQWRYSAKIKKEKENKMQCNKTEEEQNWKSCFITMSWLISLSAFVLIYLSIIKNWKNYTTQNYIKKTQNILHRFVESLIALCVAHLLFSFDHACKLVVTLKALGPHMCFN